MKRFLTSLSLVGSRHRKEHRDAQKSPWSLALLLLFLSAPLLLCDVVELKTGERLEGTFKQATIASVVIEVGGQTINMPLAKVRAIYFGAAPQRTQTAQQSQAKPSAVHEALQALKAVASATEVRVNYRDYSTRVVDAKIKVDEFLNSPQEQAPLGGTLEERVNVVAKQNAVSEAVRLAMHYYQVAAKAWGGLITHDGSFAAEAGTALQEREFGCPVIIPGNALTRATAELDAVKATGKTTEPVAIAMYAGAHPDILWHCASEKIAEAERLMK